NTNDVGTGSLRKAIECAQHGDTIFFSPTLIGQTILLTSGPILINKNINIIQALATEVLINSSFRSFQINSGTTKFKHVKIFAGCVINNYGTAIRNYGDLIMDHVTIIESTNLSCGEASLINFGSLTIIGDSKVIKQ
ncbi:MAG: hypothetical protein WBO36_11265, partial [Saprospiraceae bacterium]